MVCWMCEERDKAMRGRLFGCGPAMFTAAWHRVHQREHLAAFPNLDERSKQNLAMFVEWAEATLAY